MLATKGMHFPIDVILVCIRWYAAYPLLIALAKTDVLLLDDWGMAGIDSQTRADLMEIIDDRAANKATWAFNAGVCMQRGCVEVTS